MKTAASVPFNRPTLTGDEAPNINAALASGRYSGDGAFMRNCQEWFRGELAAASALMTPSCSLGLDLAMLVGGIGPGDEVLLPDFTFTTSAQCVALRGATPVFCDIRGDTLNLDETRLQEAVTSKTKAIIPVHYAGVSCDMDGIIEFARAHKLLIVEDAAQAVGATSNGKPVGNRGDMAAFSFHETKNIQCGEGGMLAINHAGFAERAQMMWEKGTNRRQFLQGQVEKYEWISMGSSYLSNEISAAMLWAQLQQLHEITRLRRGIWQRYHAAFADWERRGKLRRPTVPEGAGHNAHLYYVLLPDEQCRSRFQQHMNRNGIQTPFHYVPLHRSVGGRKYGRAGMALDNSVNLSSCLVRLPLFTGLTIEEQDRVIDAATAFLAAL